MEQKNVTKQYYTQEEQQKLFTEIVYLENGGKISFYRNFDNNTVRIETQNLTTINPENNTLGLLPNINRTIMILHNELRYSFDANYTSGMDIEQDTNGQNIQGRKRTDIKIFYDNGVLKVEYLIYSDSTNNNANFIVARRELTGK